MKVTRLALTDVILIEPQAFADERGMFFESFNAQRFADTTGLDVSFVQDNHSVSKKNVLRGLHYQMPPHPQGKLVRVVRGSAFDVAVDIRKNSATFAMWVGETLSAENRKQLWIPDGFAHGFLALEDDTEFLYKTTSYWNKTSERAIRWDDPTLAIDWPLQGDPILSSKDRANPVLGAIDL